MCNPFGWQPSLLAYDLTNMSVSAPMSSMNIQMNQAFADMQARSSLYMTPTMNWNCFSQYTMPSGGMDFLLNPAFTMNQWAWNNSQNGGWNMTNPWGNFGWNGSNTNPSSNTGSTPEERKYNAKYTKLLAFSKQLVANAKLSPAQKENLNEVILHNPGKTNQEKFNNLKAEYDKINKDTIRNFIASSKSDLLSVNGENNGTSFYKKLQSAGYEFNDSSVDTEVTNLYTAINNLKDDNANIESNGILGQLQTNNSDYDILDVISSWNTQKASATKESDKRLITCIAEKYKSMTNEESKAMVKSQVLDPVVNSLINRARGLKSELDAASQTKLQTAIDKLTNELSNTSSSISDSLSKAFDELYLLTRQAAIATVRAEAISAYGSIDSEVFNETLFEVGVNGKNTTDDLKEEGFTTPEIEAAQIKVDAVLDATPSSNVDETKPVKEQMNDITSLTKVQTSLIPGSTEAYIDNNTGKVYVIKQNCDGEDEVHEATGVKVENGTVVQDGNNTPQVAAAKVTPSEIDIASKAAAREKETLKAEKEAVKKLINDGVLTNTDDNIYEDAKGENKYILDDGVLYEYKDNKKGDKVTAESITNKIAAAEDEKKRAFNIDATAKKTAQQSGIQVAENLVGYTNDDEWRYVYKHVLSDVNKANVFEFLKGYKIHTSNNFFEQIEDESVDKGEKEMLLKHVVNAVIENLEHRYEMLKDGEMDKELSYDRATIKSDIDSLKTKLSDVIKYADNEDFDKIILKYAKNIERQEGLDRDIEEKEW